MGAGCHAHCCDWTRRVSDLVSHPGCKLQGYREELSTTSSNFGERDDDMYCWPVVSTILRAFIETRTLQSRLRGDCLIFCVRTKCLLSSLFLSRALKEKLKSSTFEALFRISPPRASFEGQPRLTELGLQKLKDPGAISTHLQFGIDYRSYSRRSAAAAFVQR